VIAFGKRALCFKHGVLHAIGEVDALANQPPRQLVVGSPQFLSVVCPLLTHRHRGAENAAGRLGA
jgi:hypothetical protein